jgi:beta-N-acetylhexosaminidase
MPRARFTRSRGAGPDGGRCGADLAVAVQHQYQPQFQAPLAVHTTTWAVTAHTGRSAERQPPVSVSPVWLRVGGIAVAGVAVTACATNAAADGTAGSASHSAAGPVARGAVAGPTAGSSGGSASAGASGGGSAAAGAVAASPATVQAATVASLSARQLAGQRVIYSYKGLTPPSGLLYLIRHGYAAGVIFFGNNISSKSQIAAVAKKLEKANASGHNPVRSPLLLMTDQEGGLVRRLPGEPILSEKAIGRSAHPAVAAKSAGVGAARNLRSVGMNVNLAPVLDVYRHAGNFDDQFQRSYSKNPHKVSWIGADFIKAQQGGNVAATAKHFPGLGAASATQNTDAQPVTLHVSKANLRGIDEQPYKAAIAAKVKLVMVSWAVYPSLGTKQPAGLSTHVVQGELRKHLGFTGVTVTDALDAGALRAYGSIQHRAVLAAKAGMDLLLCSGQGKGEGENCLNGLEGGYRDGTLDQNAFKAADTRVINLRGTLPG